MSSFFFLFFFLYVWCDGFLRCTVSVKVFRICVSEGLQNDDVFVLCMIETVPVLPLSQNYGETTWMLHDLYGQDNWQWWHNAVHHWICSSFSSILVCRCVQGGMQCRYSVTLKCSSAPLSRSSTILILKEPLKHLKAEVQHSKSLHIGHLLIRKIRWFWCALWSWPVYDWLDTFDNLANSDSVYKPFVLAVWLPLHAVCLTQNRWMVNTRARC